MGAEKYRGSCHGAEHAVEMCQPGKWQLCQRSGPALAGSSCRQRKLASKDKQRAAGRDPKDKRYVLALEDLQAGPSQFR